MSWITYLVAATGCSEPWFDTTEQASTWKSQLCLKPLATGLRNFGAEKGGLPIAAPSRLPATCKHRTCSGVVLA